MCSFCRKKLLFAVLFLYLFDREMNANSLLASDFGPRKLFSRPTATQFCRQHKHTWCTIGNKSEKMAVALKRCIFDPVLVKPKWV